MDIELPEFKYLKNDDGSYRVAFAVPVGGYTKQEASSIVRRLNALVECDQAIRDVMTLTS